MEITYEDVAGMIDHSLLHPTMTDADLEEGCRLALEYRVASVCIKPYWVARAAALLSESEVAVGTVVGFPHGSSTTEVKRIETQLACQDGASEIDVVINIGKALSEDWAYIEQEIDAIVEESHAHGALVKVIFENDFITDDPMKERLCEICESVGAEFVKTSTGYGFVKGSDGKYSYLGATEHDLRLMRAACSPAVQVKAAGGVRDLDALLAVRRLGVSRVGATATAAMLNEFNRRVAAGELIERDGSLSAGGY